MLEYFSIGCFFLLIPQCFALFIYSISKHPKKQYSDIAGFLAIIATIFWANYLSQKIGTNKKTIEFLHDVYKIIRMISLGSFIFFFFSWFFSFIYFLFIDHGKKHPDGHSFNSWVYIFSLLLISITGDYLTDGKISSIKSEMNNQTENKNNEEKIIPDENKKEIIENKKNSPQEILKSSSNEENFTTEKTEKIIDQQKMEETTQRPTEPIVDLLGYTLDKRQNYLPTGKDLNFIKKSIVGEYSTKKETVTLELQAEAYEAFLEMRKSALSDRISLIICSAFRSYKTQKEFVRKYGKKAEEEGFSEHQLGTGIDIKGVQYDSESFAWLATFAQNFGFILSYYPGNPQKDEDEAHHWRFVGKEAAQKYYNLHRLDYVKNSDNAFFSKIKTKFRYQATSLN